MERSATPFAATVGLSVLCVAADYLLKRASELPHPYRSAEFALGAAVYAGSAFGWVYVLRHLKLASVGATYSVIVVVLLAVVGVVVFGESLTGREVAGLGCAVASLILLSRFLAP